MATSTLTITYAQYAELTRLSEETGVPIKSLADVSVYMLDAILSATIPKDQQLLGATLPSVKGQRWGCETQTINIEAKLSKKVSTWGKVLRMSSTWLLHNWMEDFIELMSRVDTKNPSSMHPEIQQAVLKIQANPHEGTPSARTA